MSSHEETLKRKLELDRLNKEENERLLELERRRLSSGQLPDTPVVQQEEDETVSFVSTGNKSDYQKIIEDYNKQYPETAVKDTDEKGVLIFPSRDAATDFLAAQAASKPPRKFLFSEMDATSGQLMDFHFFSCGDGALYKGSMSEIQNQLQEAQKANPDNGKIKAGLELIKARLNTNASVDYKSRVAEARNSEADRPLQNENSTPAPKPGA